MHFEKLSQPIPDQANIPRIGRIDIIQTSKREALLVMVVQPASDPSLGLPSHDAAAAVLIDSPMPPTV